MKSLSHFEVGFADGHIEEYRVYVDGVKLVYSFWNNRRVILLFSDVIGLRDVGCVGGDIAEVRQRTESSFLDYVFSIVSEDAVKLSGYTEYVFVYPSGEEALSIVARDWHDHGPDVENSD